MKTYSVSKVKQLIDLNGESVNFDLKFTVKSKNNAPFDILVVDQDTLDNNSELKYKNITNGSISGQLKHDKNVYENYFLILKSDTPCECDVEIEKTDLPMKQQTLPVAPPLQQTQPLPQQSPPKLNEDKNDGFHWIKIVLGLGLIVGVGFACYWVSKKYDKAILYTPPRIQQVPTTRISSPPRIQQVPTTRILFPPKIEIAPVAKSSLVDKLKGLNLDD